MDTIVTAGGIPQPGEPLYEYTQGISKALLDIQGQPMIQWVLDALDAAETIERVVVIGLPEGTPLRCTKIAALIPNHGSMLENVRAGIAKVLEINPQAQHVLYASSDVPTVTAEMVNWVINTANQSDHDIYYNVITREVMEKRFPGSKRSYIHLRGMEVCGADMNVLRAQTTVGNEDLWEKLIEARKSAIKQASLVGYDTLFRLLFRILSLEDAEKAALKRLGLSARVIVSPYAEIGMDVDKPHQLELVRADMAQVKA